MPSDVIDIAARVRIAVYARYSSDLQRPSSIEDQIHQCSEAAARRGWEVAREYIRYDQAKSGRTLVGREGLEELVRLAEQKPRPFDGILCDDTSRFGRNLSDTLPLTDILEHAGVFLHFVNSGLDSRDPNFRLLYIAYGQQDEQASRHLGRCVHRGQEGRVRNGYVGSGRVYGYRNVPIEDPTRKGVYGRPFVTGVKLEINPEEAAVVKRIFELYVAGLGCHAIASKLNREGVPSPLKLERGKGRRIWSTFAVSSVLKNEKYIGVHKWNRTKTVRNPRTHRKEQRPRPESEWEHVDVPGWRIIDDELWNAVRKLNAGRQRKKLGGLNRTKQSRDYVFSGAMVCGECGGRINVIAGSGSNTRYGCSAHRFRGTCQNGITIRRDVLEERLLHALSRNLSYPEVIEHLSAEFQKQFAAAWKKRKSRRGNNTSELASLRERKESLRRQAGNLVDALAMTKSSALVCERLASIEFQLRGIDDLLSARLKKRCVAPSDCEFRPFLQCQTENLESLLSAAPELTKQLMLRHLGNLIMIPRLTQSGPEYVIEGDVGLFASGDPTDPSNMYHRKQEDALSRAGSAAAA